MEESVEMELICGGRDGGLEGEIEVCVCVCVCLCVGRYGFVCECVCRDGSVCGRSNRGSIERERLGRMEGETGIVKGQTCVCVYSLTYRCGGRDQLSVWFKIQEVCVCVCV